MKKLLLRDSLTFGLGATGSASVALPDSQRNTGEATPKHWQSQWQPSETALAAKTFDERPPRELVSRGECDGELGAMLTTLYGSLSLEPLGEAAVRGKERLLFGAVAV
jgi:hypothetical protein